jgi:hypothetical protein
MARNVCRSDAYCVLEDVVQGVKSSHMFKEIESLIDEMIGNVGKIRKKRENNSAAVTELYYIAAIIFLTYKREQC